MTGDPEPTLCIPNIGPKQRRFRFVSGVVSLAIAAVALGLLVWFDTPRVARLALIVPLWSGAIGVLQAREKT